MILLTRDAVSVLRNFRDIAFLTIFLVAFVISMILSFKLGYKNAQAPLPKHSGIMKRKKSTQAPFRFITVGVDCTFGTGDVYKCLKLC